MILLMAFGLIMMMKNINNLEIINSLHVHILKNTTRDGGGTAYTVYTVFTIQSALHCLNSSVYAYIVRKGCNAIGNFGNSKMG